mmetsp:Transcript_26578/g.52043  ORF Transcript_26578/g.52043 Transcript_26578/m.52043 type:complete len:200 (+) Transcript_26578:236-835(+)
MRLCTIARAAAGKGAGAGNAAATAAAGPARGGAAAPSSERLRPCRNSLELDCWRNVRQSSSGTSQSPKQSSSSDGEESSSSLPPRNNSRRARRLRRAFDTGATVIVAYELPLAPRTERKWRGGSRRRHTAMPSRRIRAMEGESSTILPVSSNRLRYSMPQPYATSFSLRPQRVLPTKKSKRRKGDPTAVATVSALATAA